MKIMSNGPNGGLNKMQCETLGGYRLDLDDNLPTPLVMIHDILTRSLNYRVVYFLNTSTIISSPWQSMDWPPLQP